MKTEAFQIVPLKPEDAVSLNELMVSNTERFKRFFPKTLSNNLTIEASESYISNKSKEIQSNSEFTFAIKDNETQNIAGLIIIKKLNWETKQGEFAYCIGSKYEGKGLTTFAVKEISNYAFNNLKLKTLQIISHKTNFGSIKVAENCGFIWKRTLSNEFTPTNELPLDMELYELTR
ncbi:GNAT family N-acetyltransferase [Flavobacterium gawalongense]|uniref:GNAT family N-acetyltransferase n=1 Tax=Flavobacterium gawalongense TaxID=2594432 RepID=A0A553BK20_9FLAO|nr:GNAT family N-acetyltransferase [Flavobacterium gawalongense]TRX00352.1 GNAT family N-acetyltransferase [Flavobacterium gawalongense]TRX08409.1 GNAT family N-acetyltransferase [Flavobacterium gawalongense]TRX08594.1 GNAT family N-acetyltransferase [Flavobacterium gawalongense]TRX09577.1 GNAT family N-acetyltransferase [Flavobacterium gawalongense]TRX25586.1 GNAT family N-acetyltransferase [Flavobacterium gawalongense]